MFNSVITTMIMKHVVVWDQTVGCELCGKAWWGERATKVFSEFHSEDCILWGKSEEHIIAGIVSREFAYDMLFDEESQKDG